MRRSRIHTSKPNIVALVRTRPRCKPVIQLNLFPGILVLFDQCAHIVSVEGHPRAHVLDTSHGTLERFLFLQARTRRTAFRGKPLVRGRRSDSRHEHEEQNSDKRDTRLPCSIHRILHFEFHTFLLAIPTIARNADNKGVDAFLPISRYTKVKHQRLHIRLVLERQSAVGKLVIRRFYLLQAQFRNRHFSICRQRRVTHERESNA